VRSGKDRGPTRVRRRIRTPRTLGGHFTSKTCVVRVEDLREGKQPKDTRGGLKWRMLVYFLEKACELKKVSEKRVYEWGKMIDDFDVTDDSERFEKTEDVSHERDMKRIHVNNPLYRMGQVS